MNLISLAEQGYLPDWLVRVGIRRLLRQRLRQQRECGPKLEDLVQMLRHSPVALATDEANRQHYEVPSPFFEAVLGPHLKYSSCLYSDPRTTLPEAEEAMLRLTCLRAELEDGMKVLDLGCGWGSLSLWMAQRYPRCHVMAVSNSTSQRRWIEARAVQRGLTNLSVVTANMRDFMTADRYDRILSVEMFEHLRNYETVLGRIASWLRPGGKLFVHIFCHRELAYPFDADGDGDWMARHFFTDGIMPSFELLSRFDRDLVVARSWQVNGQHYARTCEDWLRNLDAHRAELLPLFRHDGDRSAAAVRLQRWRIFFMACAELFGHGSGAEWLVGHYLFEPRAVPRRHQVSSTTAAPWVGNGEEVRR